MIELHKINKYYFTFSLTANCLLLLTALIALNSAWWVDPYIRSDDYPILFKNSDLFYTKTLAEGRWGNYLWSTIKPKLSPESGFLIFLTSWILIGSISMASIFNPKQNFLINYIFSLAIAVTPQLSGLALWFNTITAANLVLLAGVLGLYATQGNAKSAVLFFSTVGCFLTYPGHAFILLALALAMGGAGTSLVQMVKSLIIFTLGYGAGILSAFSLNAYAHGVFGVRLANWRGQLPLTDIASGVRNVKALSPAFMSDGLPDALNLAIGLATLALPLLGFASLRSSRPIWFNSLIAGASLSVLILAAQVVVTGAQLPPRATGFIWIYFVCSIALATRHEWISSKAGAFIGILLSAVGLFAWRTTLNQEFLDFQAYTRDLSASIERTHPDADIVLITGEPGSVAELKAMNEMLALEFRLAALLEVEVRICHDDILSPNLRLSELDRPSHIGWRDRIATSRELCSTYMTELESIDAIYPSPGSIEVITDRVAGVKLGR